MNKSPLHDTQETGMWCFRRWTLGPDINSFLHDLDPTTFDKLTCDIPIAKYPHLKFYKTKDEAIAALSKAVDGNGSSHKIKFREFL